jgi:Pentapeptide repeats (8 copies)
MSDAYYHRGFTIEFDFSVPRMTIEGRELPTESLSGLFALSDPPSVKVGNLRRYGEQLIERSPGFEKREAALQEHLAILKKGVPEWNKWRTENPTIRPLLYDSNLTKEALLVDLDGADFTNAVLTNADLRGQNLRKANFHEANLGRAKLHKADLTGANFCRTDLYETEMQEATLNDANLQGTQLAKTNFEGAQLIGCKVYGMSAWDLKLDGAVQRDLIIRYRQKSDGENSEASSETQITVDDLQVAQFIYLLLNNENIRTVIDTITSKAVLILGRFTPERKAILDAIAEEARTHHLLPIIFDFEGSKARDLTETIKILASLSLFVIVDLTNPKAAPLELQATVPDYQIPFVPIIQEGEKPFSMFNDLKKYDWVLQPILTYPSSEKLREAFKKVILDRAWAKCQELQRQKGEKIKVQSIEDFLRDT